MSRTKRFYNHPNKILYTWICGPIGKTPLWHPYKVLISTKGCLDEPLMSKRRRAYHKIEVKRELQNLCPYTSFEANCYNCSMLWYVDECQYTTEKVLYSFEQQYGGAWL